MWEQSARQSELQQLELMPRWQMEQELVVEEEVELTWVEVEEGSHWRSSPSSDVDPRHRSRSCCG